MDSRYRLTGLGGRGRNRTVPDKGFETRKKGAAEAAPSSQIVRALRPPSAGATQSSSQETEALSAAGAVRLRKARMPRAPTVWTVERRMARSRLTDQFST